MTERCKICRYRGELDGLLCCDYMTITGRSRLAQELPEDRDKPCFFFERGGKADLRVKLSRPMPQKKVPHYRYDQDKLRKLYMAGLSDHEIARRLGCQRKTVQRYRERNALPANWKGKRKEERIGSA